MKIFYNSGYFTGTTRLHDFLVVLWGIKLFPNSLVGLEKFLSV